MFVGHALLAFALVAFVGERRGWEASATLRLAAFAALFATLPDVDVVYGLVGLLDVFAGAEFAASFWDAGNRVHRGVTHSLVVGLVTTLAVWTLARREPGHYRRLTAVGCALLVGLVGLVAGVSGPLGAAVTLAFVTGAVALVALAGRSGLSARGVTGVALVGLWSHPFGDLFTGSPPAMLYPFDVVLAGERVTLAADPTLHLLGAFGVELAVVWLAVLAYFRLTDRRCGDHVDHRRAALGVAYGATALVLPAPTLDVSYHFVFSVLAVGAVAVAPAPSSRDAVPSFTRDVSAVLRGLSWKSAATALATVSVAALAYAGVYLLM